MALRGRAYACTACGAESLRWEGRCPSCGEWNTLSEAAPSEAPRRAARRPGAAPIPLSVPPPGPTRRRIGLGELDRVLGGGLVPGSVVLLGGAPGIGKSTLLLQAAARLSEAGGRALYASGEESSEQVGVRASRLGPAAGEVLFLSATSVEEVVAAAGEVRPDLLCVDSIQALASEHSQSAAGGVAQVRECAAALQAFAKRSGVSTFLIGHVTKGGTLAGPRALEHLVDVVLHLEGQRSVAGRVLRAGKNRFGCVDEVAVFRMTPAGLEGVAEPAGLFLGERPAETSGAALAVPLQGTRPMVAEVQALTVRARFTAPQRVATGFSSRRLAVLLAVLERRGGLDLGSRDIFLAVTGGLRLADPACDLAVAAALVSAELDRPVPSRLAFVGEVGLGGEVRPVTVAEERLRAARRVGLEGAVLPAASLVGISAAEGGRGVFHVRELAELLGAR